jgi:two-component system, OmpR family, sensor histidine kinase KdpD
MPSPAWVARHVVRAAAGAALVAAATSVLLLSGASRGFADIALFLVIIFAALLGYAAGVTAAVSGFLLLLFFFIPPIGKLEIRNVEDALVVVTFTIAAIFVSVVVARLNELRRRSERSAGEARLRLALTDRLLNDIPLRQVLEQQAREVHAMFGLRACVLAVGDVVATAGNPVEAEQRDGPRSRTVTFGELEMTIVTRRRLADDELATVDVLGAGLALALDRIRLQNEANENVLQADLAKARAGFLTAITHDLQTPLATIKAATAALMVDSAALDAEERRELLETAHHESSELTFLVKKVLELTRIRAEAVTPRSVPVAPVDLALAAATRVERTTNSHPLCLDVPPELPPVDVDPSMIEEVLVNLLENAVQHSPPSSPVMLGAVHEDRVVQLKVVDHGPGIPIEERDRVFEEFVRLSSGDRRGMGLGLAITRTLVEANAGTVWCDESPGGGATFVVAVPTTARDG